MLDAHVNDAFKVAPLTTPPTTRWNATMSLCDIFDQLATTYGKPTPDTMHQKTSPSWLHTIRKTPPGILFKQCTNCQEIEALAQNPYTTQQLLLNAFDLIA